VLVCLTGTAGVGKTATVVHWGHRVRERFPDGQLYVDLRGYDPDQPISAADALAGFLTALLPAGAEIPLGDAERAARLRTELAGRRMLVVLDNAHTVEQVRMLLPGTSSCLVVVTSRDSLAGLVALHGAHRIAVDQLPLPDAVALLRRLIGPRVDTDPSSAEALAERCARLPLTLRLAAELAASRPAAPLSRLVDELHAALDVLSSGTDTRAAVRAVFSWSLRQLSDAATQAFAALGRHPAPTFDAHGLAALAGVPLKAARALLDTLVRAHLVQPAGADRYGMHDLLKAYAAEIGGVDERAARDRLYGYYLATIAAAMDRLYPGEAHRRPRVAAAESPIPDLPGTGEAREWLDAELSTVADLTAHAATRDRPSDAIVVAQLLFRYLDGHHQTMAIVIHDHACAAARTTGDRAAAATAIHMRSNVHLYAGRVAEAEADLRAAIELFEEIDDRCAQARSLDNVGMLFERAGQYLVAIEHYTTALALSDEDADLTGRAHILTRLGTTEARIGHSSAAQAHLGGAMTLHRRAGHRFGRREYG
jgi:tetratricopeptide (TPR) repeat protein